MKRRRFNSEFRREAARMLIIEDLNAREVSEQVGAAENRLMILRPDQT